MIHARGVGSSDHGFRGRELGPQGEADGQMGAGEQGGAWNQESRGGGGAEGRAQLRRLVLEAWSKA